MGADAPFISKIIADERTNSLIVMANDEALVELKELIGRIDIDIDPASRSQIHVIYLEHAKAEEIASALSSDPPPSAMETMRPSAMSAK